MCKTGISTVDVTGVGNAALSPCRQRGHHQCRASAQVRSPCTRALQLPHRPDFQCSSLHLHSGSKSRKTLCTAESPLKHHILDAAGAVGGKHGSSKQRRCVCCQCRVYPGKHSARAVQRAQPGNDRTFRPCLYPAAHLCQNFQQRCIGLRPAAGQFHPASCRRAGTGKGGCHDAVGHGRKAAAIQHSSALHPDGAGARALYTAAAAVQECCQIADLRFSCGPALKDLPACTMEIRMYANGWRTSGHMISSLIGVEENFLLRVGDESIKNPAQLQLAGRGTSITAPNALSLGRWYHIAVVDNGSEMTIYIDGNAEISVDSSSSKAINLGFYYNSPFAIGMSAADVRYFNGYVSEARVWKRALTPTELKNNQCYVDPATAEGLIGYWRLDQVEDDGRTFTDLSGNGYHGKASSNPIWTGEIKCPVVD